MKLPDLNAIACGKTQCHLSQNEPFAGLLHQRVVAPFVALQDEGKKHGFDIQIASGFRSFDRQLIIWNEKSIGQRAVLDDDGQPIDMSILSSEQAIQRICRWSAIPGASRHHWGTDIDIYDGAALTGSLQLTHQETETCFAAMHEWLDDYLPETEFFRPYQLDNGGIGPERWHLSYLPIAQQYQQAWSIDLLQQVLAEADIAFKSELLDNIDNLFQRYIKLPS